MKPRCSICGGKEYERFSFKGGYVCDGCLHYLKENFETESLTRSSR